VHVTVTRHELDLLRNAVDLAADAEWLRPDRQEEFEELSAKLDEQVPEPPPHGTYARYQVCGGACRCPDCKRANADYMKSLRDRRPVAR
jgi:hypothetical protein